MLCSIIAAEVLLNDTFALHKISNPGFKMSILSVHKVLYYVPCADELLNQTCVFSNDQYLAAQPAVKKCKHPIDWLEYFIAENSNYLLWGGNIWVELQNTKTIHFDIGKKISCIFFGGRFVCRCFKKAFLCSLGWCQPELSNKCFCLPPKTTNHRSLTTTILFLLHQLFSHEIKSHVLSVVYLQQDKISCFQFLTT